MILDVINFENDKVGDIDLDMAIYGVEVRSDILARTVKWQLAKRHTGNHKVKDRSEVKHTTKKMYRQKGTGGARHGMKSVVQFRGGGVVFGPSVRSHATELTKKFRRLALKTALSSKLAEGKLVILDSAELSTPKTKDLMVIKSKMGWDSVLVIDGTNVDNNLLLAARNIINFDVLPTMGANVYDIIRHDSLVLTKEAVEKLAERLR